MDRPIDLKNMKNLSEQFVMKPTHGSGCFKIVTDFKSENIEQLVDLCKHWCSRNLGVEMNEFAFRDIQPRILIEELLSYPPPIDYRFLCFNGKAKLIYTSHEENSKRVVNVFDLNFNPLPVRYSSPLGTQTFRPPSNLEEMIRISEKLSKNHDFVRVDLYNINGRIVFGEMTNYPNAGLGRFDPPEWDEKMLHVLKQPRALNALDS